MSAEMWTAFSDVGLALGTLALGLSLKTAEIRFGRNWLALFVALSLSAALGALYHGISFFHTLSFWTLTAASSTTSIFLFFICCLGLSKPHLKWLKLAWPAAVLLGLVVGALVAQGPFFYVSIIAGVVSLLSAIVVKSSKDEKARFWIWAGLMLTIGGLVFQKVLKNEGALNNNVIFHILQFAGNFCFFQSAKSQI